MYPYQNLSSIAVGCMVSEKKNFKVCINFCIFFQGEILRWLLACLSVAVFPVLPVAMGFVDRRFV